MTDSCCMAWLVLSTSSLLDYQYGGEVPEDKLESLVRRSGYKPVTLKNVLRSSSNINTATTIENVNKYSGVNIPELISPGSCSTVTGTRPTCYLYKDSDCVNYKVMARCVNQYLEQNKSQQTVILCERRISPRQVKPLLTGDVTLYDAGVEEFDDYNTPRQYSADLARQREDLVKWINNGGVLLTHDTMFRGCEAETVVFLAKYWGSIGGQTRSGPTRAVSQLCIVIGDLSIKLDEMKQHFTVIDRREDQGVSLLDQGVENIGEDEEYDEDLQDKTREDEETDTN